jgi:membrane protease YdiL (CAAX protease family)
MGIAVGLLAGFFEETGWTGYAFPRMSLKYGALAAAVYLGLFHSTWHVVADYLGSSAALGAYWLPHFLAFMTLATTATRVLIAWVYLRTQSVLLAQLMHASSTGCLFMLTPTGLTPAADTLWYAVYAVVCVAGAVVVAKDGRAFGRAGRG